MEGILCVTLSKPQQPQPSAIRSDHALNPHFWISKEISRVKGRQTSDGTLDVPSRNKPISWFRSLNIPRLPHTRLKKGLIPPTTGLPTDSPSCDRQRLSITDDIYHMLNQIAKGNLCFFPKNNLDAAIAFLIHYLSPVFCWRLTHFNLIFTSSKTFSKAGVDFEKVLPMNTH